MAQFDAATQAAGGTRATPPPDAPAVPRAGRHERLLQSAARANEPGATVLPEDVERHAGQGLRTVRPRV